MNDNTHTHIQNVVVTYNITKLGIWILGLHPLPIGIGIQEEGTHVALRAVGVLILLTLLTTLILRLGDFLLVVDGIDIFFVGAHGCDE